MARLTDDARMDGWRLRFVYGQPPARHHRGEEWRLAHQRALREAHGDDLDGNESAPYGLSVPANPRILQMRGRGKGTGGRGKVGSSVELVLGNRPPGAGPPRSRQASLTDHPPWVCLHHHLSGWVPGWKKRPCLSEHPLWVSFCLSPPASDSLSFSESSCIFPSSSFCPSLAWPSPSPLFPSLLPLPAPHH